MSLRARRAHLPPRTVTRTRKTRLRPQLGMRADNRIVIPLGPSWGRHYSARSVIKSRSLLCQSHRGRHIKVSWLYVEVSKDNCKIHKHSSMSRLLRDTIRLVIVLYGSITLRR